MTTSTAMATKSPNVKRNAQPILVTLFESISVNGIIARPDDDAGFFTNINWTAFIDVAKEAGAMVWGRRTHEMYGGQAIADLQGVRGFVLTSNRKFRVEVGWRVATTPKEAVKLAAEAGSKGLAVVGGSSVNAAFAQAGLIDKVVLNVESVLIGEGIPLFAPTKFDIHLELREIKKLTSTVIQIRYDVHLP